MKKDYEKNLIKIFDLLEGIKNCCKNFMHF